MTHTLELTLGEALRLMRERAGFSQAQIAGFLELSRNTVSRYEDGRFTPKWKDVDSWARICDHDPQVVRQLWEDSREFGCIHGSAPPHCAPYRQLSWLEGCHDSYDLTPDSDTVRAAAKVAA